MKHLMSRGLSAGALSLLLLAGCGGGGDGGITAGGSAGAPGAPGAGGTVQSLLAFMSSLIDGTSETSEPVPLDNSPLATDDTV